MNYATLFSPLQIGAIQISNRIVMAPLTRMRAGAGSVPTALNAEHYAQRATAGPAGIERSDGSDLRLASLSLG
jgi:N-ethylmaleimide reductase